MGANKDITGVIIDLYNCTRLHSTLGNLTLEIDEKERDRKKAIKVPRNTLQLHFKSIFYFDNTKIISIYQL
jgi:hypothetical protein